ncbi:hypothetical protein [Telluria beijingensis]|uniref:hypothetical protein n=1 Tax=Telluria beijingensis TaxID=3068633 RepID=UPI0027954937|nr:hypothetical protein [Massilia sp. REN29]
MDTNKRTLPGNQADYGANEKDTPGAKGVTRDGPNDHTYPNAASRQHGNSAIDESGGNLARGGSMQGQQTGGSGTTQGVSDSHDRQMQMHSDAWGKLEQPIGNRQRDTGVSVSSDTLNRQGKTQTGETLNPQDPAHPELHAAEPGRDGRVPGTVAPEPVGTEAGVPGVQHGDIYGNRQGADDGRADTQDASNSQVQRETDRERQLAQAGSEARDKGSDDVHQSNNVSGGLPRSPGNSGPRTEGEGYQVGGSMHADPNPVHQSNDAAGGYPRSPGGANKLAGDRKMDDDTGFSRG